MPSYLMQRVWKELRHTREEQFIAKLHDLTYPAGTFCQRLFCIIASVSRYTLRTFLENGQRHRTVDHEVRTNDGLTISGSDSNWS